MILMQLTVLGYLNTGKTALINSIMNNDIYSNYVHTDLPTVYYKVHKEKNRSFCVEIEDTSVNVDVNVFMNMLRKEITTDSRSMRNPVFSLFDKPTIPFQAGDQYNSISYGRMAYFLVFDLTNASTLEYVKMIYGNMSKAYDRYYTLKPFISLVGNKYDLVTEDCELVRQAENFANENMVQLWLTSATTGRNVKKLFTHTIHMVYNNTNLWKYDIEESGSETTES
ncbi:GTPase, putative [Plasmodium knowlesi strain H]|uniref:GTPase, putative n=3 Tax=Plasmodium knowlesi TaxID=5850 RepID=A0A5K1VE05_PLAKH|nr:GTPase, putative [Plasmodium knowlesi strain H]OTN66378.1 putative GTPase [Plasmodium knowlesi]CAA9989853.1 GTPase, putative [Plasmodium knowlesi strain H]SBO24406.1 GTPase, putative [Plasmodium knowlesi strain H]SBO26603.1 GTPase, putative [Plasmodium knowlesi strain H]VVS79327.1 GTPase, putative [Plasmodium knowlesi strain H]|eukprot:XP_002259868.1 GTPase, putative [Plasmodium knowlesi strain H]